MSSPIQGFTPTLPTSSAAKPTGLNSMDSSAFLKLMLSQLQQQDPLNPTDSNQLLSQLSQISTLQSNTTMTQNIQGLTLQQSIGAAGNLIGKKVAGIDTTGTSVDGLVTSVKVENKNVLLELDTGHQLPLSNLTNIAAASASTTPTPTPATPPASSPAAQSSAAATGGTLPTPGVTDVAKSQAITTVINAMSQLGLK